MSIQISVSVNSNVYLRDPLKTELGKNILGHSVVLIQEIGFEAFNFKRLAEAMGSTEASVYRYFENKHKLLIYLTSWYWDYLHFCINFQTRNLSSSRQKLEQAIKTMVNGGDPDAVVDFIDQAKLHKIMVEESSKAYHTKLIDEENKIGLFANFKNLSNIISEIIEDLSPDFPYPHALSTTLLEMSVNQVYYAEHLPSLTEVEGDKKRRAVEDMLIYFTKKLLAK